MTQEEKAKAYDKALERASKLRVQNPFDTVSQMMEHVFPELKESEDERIRKAIIEFFESEDDNTTYALVPKKDILAWLEKQGNIDLEFFESGENEKREFVGYGFLKCKGDFLSFKEGETYWLEYVGKDNYNVRSDNLLGQTFHITPQQLYTVFRPTTWLEKQGQQDDYDDNIITRDDEILQAISIGLTDAEKDLGWSDFGGLPIEEIHAWLEKQGEQKHHEYTLEQAAGIFLDALSNTPYNNKPITDAQFITKELLKFLDDASSYNPNSINEQAPADKVEPKFHEGEWIVDSQGFTHQIERVVENVTTHTFGYDIVGGGYFNEDNKNIHLWTIQDAKDGDVLASGHLVFIFKVIYGVWLNCHCSAHNDGSFIADSYDLMTNKYFSEVHPATKEQRDLLFAKMKEAGYEWDIEKKELKKIEKKLAWSDEDEKILNTTISFLSEYAAKGYENAVMCMDWLKSLKQRMGEHEKQDVQNLANSAKIGMDEESKWTDEDEESMQHCCGAVAAADYYTLEDKEEMANWLVSLKQRIHVSSAKTCKNDTLLDLLNKMPSYITVDGIFYHFILRKTAISYMAFYDGEGEGSGKVIFAMTAYSPIDLLNEMLEKLKKKGLLE